ncbi:bifunctional diguanylate cyclase/phosphodiesterase [Andreprevotia sp. IGB-42]|uniref:putative bifunctional diguanylate cyclase/phosphodiesterase n=1 Tax=Andreprevotia sp. IGB-42 TaxID=2497473 RepID=UPI00135762F8|nr:EAL domain-containing protein [Andreprevotia sp. IGB-42]
MERLKVLILEDVPTDAELVLAELKNGGIDADIRRSVSRDSFAAALDSFMPDIILADYYLPGFDGLTALALRNERQPDTPFIFVTGSLGEERAIETLRAGATDYIIKDRMTRLPAAIVRAREERRQKRERARIAGELEAERQLVTAILNTTKALVTVLDQDGHILHLNPAAEHALGQSREAILGSLFWETLQNPDAIELARWHIRLALEWNSPLPIRAWRVSTGQGRTILWSTGRLTTATQGNEQLILCGIDITDQEEAEEKIYFLGHFDTVTGLANRKLFIQQLEEQCILQRQRETGMLVVMMIGIARIQEIRDGYGEALINQLLAEIVQRLRPWPAKPELLARVADNTFAIAFNLGDDAELSALAPYILEQLRQPIELEERHWSFPTYAGTAIYPRDAQEPALLLQAAEAALHCAEANTDVPHGYAFYTPLLSDEARERLQLESELRESLTRDDQLVLHYQPQISVAEQTLVGLESLVRWNHPRFGLLQPARFITLAEVCGLMPQLGRWVLRQSCRQIHDWQEAGFTPPTVAVNLSASQFSDAALLQDITDALNEFGVRPAQLEVELTESASMRDPHTSIAIMTQLKNMGLSVSIDDFGTGYSNLAYLKRFPVDRLKLDQTFVREITTDANDLAISRAVIAMAHQLHLEVVAEGVERAEQLALLADAGCDTVQGYYFSRPVAAEHCMALFLKEQFSGTA